MMNSWDIYRIVLNEILIPCSLLFLFFSLLDIRMELEDFCYYFQMLFICCENPSFIDRDVDCGWKYRTYEGSWVAGKSAGGGLSDCEFHHYATAAPAHQSSSAEVFHCS